MTVNVYAKGGRKHSPNSTCTEVKLYVNGNQVGSSPIAYSSQFTASMDVGYKPGIIKAVCVADGHELASTQYQTAGAVSRLELVADRSSIEHSRDDLAFVTVNALDANGILVPDASLDLKFSLDSASVGEIAAVGNGDPRDLESHQGSRRKTWRGKALVILRPTGTTSGRIVLTASCKGLPSSTIVVKTSGDE